jgi:hypothetical protein
VSEQNRSPQIAGIKQFLGLTGGRELSTCTARLVIMESRAKIYRQRAEECEEIARTVKNRVTSAHFKEIAKQWLDLAAAVDTLVRDGKLSN